MPRVAGRLARLCVVAWAVFASSAGQAGDAQPDPPAASEPADTPASLLAEAETSDLDESARQSIVRLAQEAAEQRRLALALSDQAAEFRSQAASASGRLAQVRAELNAPPATEPITPEINATLPQLEQRLSQATADLNAARQALTDLAEEEAKRRERRLAIPAEIAAARQRLDALRDEAAPDGTDLTSRARAVRVQASIAKAEAEIESLAAELQSYDARQELLPARRDRAALRVQQAERAETAWRSIVQNARSAEAVASAQDAQRMRREAARQSPVLRQFAATTEQLAQERASRDGVPLLIADAEREITAAREKTLSLREQYVDALAKLNATGLSRSTGLLLRRQFESLPDEAELRRSLRGTREDLEDAELALMDRRDRRAGAGDIDGVVRALTREAEAAGPIETPDDFQAAARDLAVARRDLLSQLIADSNTYLDRLVTLEQTRATLLEATTRYDEFIRERILWFPSITPERSDINLDPTARGGTLRDPTVWESTGLAARSAASRVTLPGVLCVLALGLALPVWWWARRTTRRLAEQVRTFRSDNFRLTLAAGGLCLLAALAPFVSWWSLTAVLQDAEPQTPPLLALATAVEQTRWLVIALLIAMGVIWRDGLAEAHFRWPPRTVSALRRRLRLFAPLFVALVVVATAIDRTGDTWSNAWIGRIAYSLAQIMSALFALAALHPTAGLIADHIARRPGSLIARFGGLLCFTVVALPITLIVISWLGYHYTALRLSEKLGFTVVLGLGLVLANAILMRWLFVARRRVAVEDAKRRRDLAIKEAAAKQDAATGPTESSIPPIEEEKLDLPAISNQTTQLFRVLGVVVLTLGMLGIWADVLPALRALERVQIWPAIEVREIDFSAGIDALNEANASLQSNAQAGAAADAPALDPIGADATAATDTIASSITLADLIAAIVILVLTVVGFRNLPGLAEIFILQRLPLEPSSRFALTTTLRYLIAFIGIFSAAAALEVEWDKIQWLAAALTFGLGFGLQEIFANFVSGLIILAERPVRIGDTVTVGNVTGNITKIRMRATTITDWDRKELIIPNRQFITGEVINWTLSDPTLRVIVRVGVAYGSDIKLVEETLMRLGAEQPLVLKDPAHYVYFKAFGDSTLDFELRVFIPHIDHLLTVQHQLNTAIDAAFREQGIEIAFPQRDLHIRSADSLVALAHELRRTGEEPRA